MEFGLAFSYVFQDSDWFKKVGLIGLVTLIPIVGQLVLFGWYLEVIRRVINDDPVPLPELDFGGQLTKGLQGWVIALVYILPMIILTIPIAIVPVLGETLDMGADTVNTMMMAISCICGGIMLIYGLLMGFMIPAAIGKFVDEGSLGAAFRIGDIFGLVRAAPIAYLLVLLGSMVAQIVGQLGSIACVIGLLITMPYSMAIIGHLIGQAYKQATAALG